MISLAPVWLALFRPRPGWPAGFKFKIRIQKLEPSNQEKMT